MGLTVGCVCNTFIFGLKFHLKKLAVPLNLLHCITWYMKNSVVPDGPASKKLAATDSSGKHAKGLTRNQYVVIQLFYH